MKLSIPNNEMSNDELNNYLQDLATRVSMNIRKSLFKVTTKDVPYKKVKDILSELSIQGQTSEDSETGRVESIVTFLLSGIYFSNKGKYGVQPVLYLTNDVTGETNLVTLSQREVDNYKSYLNDPEFIEAVNQGLIYCIPYSFESKTYNNKGYSVFVTVKTI